MAGLEICVVLVCVWEDHGVVSRVPGLHRAHVSAALKANSDAHSDARTLAAAAILCEGPTESRMRSSSSLRFCSCDALSYLQTFKGMRE